MTARTRLGDVDYLNDEDSPLNEVDLDTVAGLASAITDNPILGDTTWGATVNWIGGFRSEALIRDFEAIPSDEPAGLGGSDRAPNPVEQLIAALGNCLAVGYAVNASAAGIELKDLTIELEGDLNLSTFLGLGAGNAGYSGIRAKVRLDSDADPDALAVLHEKVTSTSPVGHTLSRSVPVTIELA